VATIKVSEVFASWDAMPPPPVGNQLF